MQSSSSFPFINFSCEGTGVALTFEKLRIANAQHGKNYVSSPAAKATISTDLRNIDKHENTRRGGNLRCLDPRQVLYKPSLLGAKNEKTKRISMCEVTVFCVQ